MDSSSVLVILKFFVLYMLTANAKSYQVNTSINHHGYINDASRLPRCRTGGKIVLSSYRYIHNPRRDSAWEQTLSPAAEMIIHQMCSLKESCDTQRFPVADLSEQETILLEVKYQCLGIFDTLIDICGRRKKAVDGIAHLMLTETALSHETCECFVEGEFTLTLADVRLKSAKLSKCSNARFQVQGEIYSCNPAKANFGSVFGKRLTNQMTSAYIYYGADSNNTRPEMIYLTISATGIAEISCERVLRYNTTISITKSSTQILHTKEYVNLKGNRSCCKGIAVPVWAMALTLSGLGGLLVISTGVIFYYRRKFAQSSRLDERHAGYLTCTGSADRLETPETETRMHETTAQAQSVDMGSLPETYYSVDNYAPVAGTAVDQYRSKVLKASEQYEIPDVDPKPATETAANYEILNPKSRSNGNDYAIPTDST